MVFKHVMYMPSTMYYSLKRSDDLDTHTSNKYTLRVEIRLVEVVSIESGIGTVALHTPLYHPHFSDKYEVNPGDDGYGIATLEIAMG